MKETYNYHRYMDKRCWIIIHIVFSEVRLPVKKLAKKVYDKLHQTRHFSAVYSVRFSNCLLFGDSFVHVSPRDLMHAGSLNPYGIPVAQLPSPCMPSDPFTLRLFRLVPAGVDRLKDGKCGGLQEKSDGFGKMAVRYESLTMGEEIIRPEIRRERRCRIVPSPPPPWTRARGPVDVRSEKFTARARRRRCNEEAKSKINIRKV